MALICVDTSNLSLEKKRLGRFRRFADRVHGPKNLFRLPDIRIPGLSGETGRELRETELACLDGRMRTNKARILL